MKKLGLITVFGCCVTIGTLVADDDAQKCDWPMFGQNSANTASTGDGAGLSVKTAPSLKTKWTFTTGGDVSARAAVVNDVAYFPDWGGNLWAVDTETGKKIWGHQLSDYGLAPNTVSRSTVSTLN